MKALLCLLLAVSLLTTCKENTTLTKLQGGGVDSKTANKSVKDSILQQQMLDSINAVKDSLRELSIISAALKYAKTHLDESKYIRTVNVLDTFSVRLSFGNLFEDGRKHLYIFDERDQSVYMNIYSLEHGEFIKQLSLNEWGLNFTDDEIKDVNGDGFRDFIYHYYPSAGCCMRDINMTYIYKSSNGFADNIRLPNPTYYPKEKLIRGVEYGHPGEVPLYKFKWRGDKLDTIEYIYPADSIKKKYYRVARWGDEEIPSKRKVLNQIPTEYYKVVGLDWFLDY